MTEHSAASEPSEQEAHDGPTATDETPKTQPETDDLVVRGPVYRPSLVFLVVVSLLTMAADLGSKWWIVEKLSNPKPGTPRNVPIVDDLIQFIFARNEGAVWGFLKNESETIRRPFLVIVSIAALIFIFSIFRKLEPHQKALKWGLPLVFGGALGNLVDRLRYGYVVDFIDVKITSTWHWPTFNVADIAICVGVGLMAIDMFQKAPEQRPEAKSAGESTPEDQAPAQSSESS